MGSQDSDCYGQRLGSDPNGALNRNGANHLLKGRENPVQDALVQQWKNFRASSTSVIVYHPAALGFSAIASVITEH